MATLYRVYKSRTQIERYRIFSIYFTGLMALTAVAAHLVPAWWVYVLYTIYLVWSPYHYSGQNYGIGVMYLRRGGVTPSEADRWLLYLACIGPYLGYAVFINMQSVGGFNPMFLRLGIPFETGRILFSLFAAAGFASAVAFLVRLRGRVTPAVAAPVVVILLSQTAWFSLLGTLGVFRQELGLGTFRAEALVPAVAFLHCAQYLGVTAYYEEREAAAEQRSVSYLRYMAVLVLGGVFLWLGTSRLLASTFDLDYGLSFLIMTAIINLHHFVIDGAIWKLRDGRLFAVGSGGEAAGRLGGRGRMVPPTGVAGSSARGGRGGCVRARFHRRRHSPDAAPRAKGTDRQPAGGGARPLPRGAAAQPACRRFRQRRRVGGHERGERPAGAGRMAALGRAQSPLGASPYRSR
jgi:hypothetical protein